MNINKISGSKTAKVTASLILFVFCIGINIYFRLAPSYFPQLENTARHIVRNKVHADASKMVEKLYPDDNPYFKDNMIKELVSRKLEDKNKFKQAVESEYKRLKNIYQDETGQSYLLGLDSYQWMINTENVLKFGYPGDKKEENKIYDTYALAPLGSEVFSARLLFYLSAFFYKICNFFFRLISLKEFLFYLPLFYTLIFLSLVYLFAQKLFSFPGACFTTLFIGLNNMFIVKSSAGWFDYDVLNLIMPLLITWFLYLGLKDRHNIKKLFFYSLLASVFQGLYVFAWTGWWFIFIVAVVFFLCSMINNYFVYTRDFRKANKENTYYLLSCGIFILGSIVFCFLIAGVNLIESLFILIKENVNLGTSYWHSIWPNVYYTVRELNRVGIGNIVERLGGKAMFAVSLAGMFWICFIKRREKSINFFYIMFFWFLFMWFASFKGVRFVLFASVPLGFFLGGFISGICPKADKMSFNLRSGYFIYVLSYILLCVFIVSKLFFSGLETSFNIVPIMNDNWQKALICIKNNSPRETVINSWWDYGNLFKATAKRRVIFDGQTQNNSNAYWMARVLLSEDEKEAVRILQMLNNASYTTFPLLNKHITDPFKCVAVLEELLHLSEEQAKVVLSKENVPEDAIGKIIGNLYDTPAPACFIVDESMIGKMLNISFLGNWDFVKLYVYKNMHKPEQEIVSNICSIFGVSLEDARRYYEEMVMIPGGKDAYEIFSKKYYFYTLPVEEKREGNILYFDNGLLFNFDSKQALVYSLNRARYEKPSRVILSEAGREEEVVLDSGRISEDGMPWLFKAEKDDKYKSMFIDKPLVNSLFARLYFLKGKGLKYFEPFYMDADGGIYVYRIKWEELSE